MVRSVCHSSEGASSDAFADAAGGGIGCATGDVQLMEELNEAGTKGEAPGTALHFVTCSPLTCATPCSSVLTFATRGMSAVSRACPSGVCLVAQDRQLRHALG